MRYTKPNVIVKIDKRFKLSKYGYICYIRIKDYVTVEILKEQYKLLYIITNAEMNTLYEKSAYGYHITQRDMLYAYDDYGYFIVFKNEEDAFMMKMGL